VAGLYEGVEELAFTSVAGGFVFQINNPWFFGPRRRYFVNETQKSAISARLRETLRRLMPLVIAAAILIPVVLIGGTFWLGSRGATLNVAVTSATGKTTSYDQPITREGATVTLAGEAGAKMVYRVTGFPGKDAVMTYSWVDATGKAGAPSSTPFGPAGMKVAIVDDNKRRINSAVLVGRRGATPNAIMLYAALLGLATFAPYFAAIHLYSLRRLRPLLADLPRFHGRVAARDKSQTFASKISFKLLSLMSIGSAMICLANSMTIIAARLEHRPLLHPLIIWIAAGASALVTARLVYLIILKARLRRGAISLSPAYAQSSNHRGE